MNWISWFLSPTKKHITENHIDFYSRIIDLEEKYKALLSDVVRLEEENIELTNELYRLENSLDSRIDIITEHCRIIRDV